MILKHRDTPLVRFEWTSSEEVRVDSVDGRSMHLLPLAFGAAARGDRRALERALAAWLLRRSAPMGRHFIRDLMFSLGLNMRDPDFHRKALDLSLGLSLNDVHWVVPDDFRKTWADCNLYTNDFSKSMAAIAFTGFGVRAADETTTSPEMTTNGMLPKCWRRVGDCVVKLCGFRFRRHHHYNLPEERIALIERFLQKRVADILQNFDRADDSLQITEARVGVNSKMLKNSVGVKTENDENLKALEGDALALQILWNLKANPLMTQAELSNVLGRETRTVERKVRKLRDAQLLRRVGSDKSGSWEVMI